MLIDIAVKTLWRRKLRSLLTILGVGVAIQLYLVMSAILVFYDSDIQKQVAMFAGKVFVQRPVQTVGAGEDFPSINSTISAESAGDILAMDGVNREESSAVLFISLVADVRPNMPPAYFIVGVEPGHEKAFLGDLELQSGALDLSGPRGVVLGPKAADHYRPSGSGTPAKPGDTVRIVGKEFTVVGVLEWASSLYDGTVIMPLSTAQDLFNHPQTVSAVILIPFRVDGVEQIQAAIRAAYPNLQASNQKDIAKNAVDMMVMQKTFFGLINYSAILTTVMVVMIVVLIVVIEQRKDIGTLRAVGSRKRRIFAMVLSESLILSLCGGVAALPLSAVFNRILNYGLFMNGAETIRLWATTFGWCLLIGLLASLLPAWQAMRVDPLSALQME
jgi:putative ABC transport system permease protein